MLFLLKKSNDYFLVELPSPQCCVSIAVECVEVMHSLLVVLLPGDVETNPGPTEARLAEFKKLSVGQVQIISEVQDLNAQLHTSDRNIANLNERITELEDHYKEISTLQSDLQTACAEIAQRARMVLEINARMDDAENRSQRKNLIVYGIPDPVPHETSV